MDKLWKELQRRHVVRVGGFYVLVAWAFSEGIEMSDWIHRDPLFRSLHDYPPFQDLLQPKG